MSSVSVIGELGEMGLSAGCIPRSPHTLIYEMSPELEETECLFDVWKKAR